MYTYIEGHNSGDCHEAGMSLREGVSRWVMNKLNTHSPNILQSQTNSSIPSLGIHASNYRRNRVYNGVCVSHWSPSLLRACGPPVCLVIEVRSSKSQGLRDRELVHWIMPTYWVIKTTAARYRSDKCGVRDIDLSELRDLGSGYQLDFAFIAFVTPETVWFIWFVASQLVNQADLMQAKASPVGGYFFFFLCTNENNGYIPWGEWVCQGCGVLLILLL